MTERAALPEILARRHLALGWSALAIFVGLGLVLEALLAWKSSAYVDAGSEARRTMWRLAHAHGTGLAMVQIAYGLTLRAAPSAADALTSRCLVAAMALVPVGFFAGGLSIHGGDPGLLVVLAPAGGVALLVGVARAALAVRSA